MQGTIVAILEPPPPPVQHPFLYSILAIYWIIVVGFAATMMMRLSTVDMCSIKDTYDLIDFEGPLIK